MNRTRRRVVGSLAAATLILTLGSISGAQATDELPIDGDVIVGDFDSGEIVGSGEPGLQALLAPTTGAGYAYTATSPTISRSYGDFTVQLVSSSRVDSLRAALQASANDINANGGASLSVSTTTVSTWPARPAAGTIYLRVDGRDSCGAAAPGTWAGCATTWIGRDDSGLGVVQAGQIWIASVAVDYTQAQQQHVLTHELGHTLGLAHYEPAFNGEYQVMHPSKYDATTLRSGDINGLRPLYQNSVSVRSQVQAMYSGLLGRSADDSGMGTWSAQIAQHGTAATARSMMSSTEYRTRVINNAYQKALGRSADSGGLSTHLRSMANGLTEQELHVTLWSSDEAWQQAGKNTSTWVTRLYQGVLGRTPSAAEVNNWVPQVNQQGRAAVARNVLRSVEHADQYINAQYQLLFARNADASGKATWRGLVQTGQQAEVTVSLMNSAEFRQRAITQFG
ncbi:DUF4214 domain-containing protein [Cellulomonas sp. NPDC089187]|uniref:DUF4214 domain-containing protein n=1 Tax=Cellulomonas sp. NPDC089187 TaxID=3154970 RepID=UPI003415BF2E